MLVSIFDQDGTTTIMKLQDKCIAGLELIGSRKNRLFFLHNRVASSKYTVRVESLHFLNKRDHLVLQARSVMGNHLDQLVMAIA